MVIPPRTTRMIGKSQSNMLGYSWEHHRTKWVISFVIFDYLKQIILHCYILYQYGFMVFPTKIWPVKVLLVLAHWPKAKLMKKY